jgi:hypothetical protein
MPGDGLRVLQLYPKSDFFTGAERSPCSRACSCAFRLSYSTVLSASRWISSAGSGTRRSGWRPSSLFAKASSGPWCARGASGKIEVIYSGTDTERFCPGLDALGIRAELGLSRRSGQ